MPTQPRNLATLAAAVLALVTVSQTARAQVPQPTIPDANARNGAITRFIPIHPHLPPDPRRDRWYDTRWGDPPNRSNHPNFYRNGGLYGLPWKANHTASIYPYFYGSPGKSSLNADDHPVSYLQRLPRMLLHPFKPVGMYYDQGSYVPIHDLDPLVPGPGPWPYPFYQKLTGVGG